MTNATSSQKTTRIQTAINPMPTPVFTIIIATYNRAHLIGRAITSILAQSFADFELLIVDGSPNDQTREALKAFADPRLRYVRQTDNSGGVSQARNLGIELAIADYIVFVDDDDAIDPSFLSEVDRAFSQSTAKVGFLWTWKSIEEELPTGIKRHRTYTYNFDGGTPMPGSRFIENSAGGSGGLVVRARALEEVGGFNAEFNSLEDIELLVRLAKRFDFIVLPQTLYTIFQHPGARLSTPSIHLLQLKERILETYHDDYKKFPQALSNNYKTIGKRYYNFGDKLSGRRNLLRLIRHQPLKWRYWILLLMLENLDYMPDFVRHKIFPPRR